MDGARIHLVGERETGEYTPVRTYRPPSGRPVTIGREGDFPLGVDPLDGKVSRIAVIVTAAPDGWHVKTTNLNGADIQLWGQAPMVCPLGGALWWPRITISVRGHEALRHLVLLDDPALTISPARPQRTGRLTESLAPPPMLTAAQQEALRLLYADLLAWPPRKHAQPLRIHQVANRLGICPESVRRRLEEARRKAFRLGLGRDVPLTDPEYLHILVRAGYLTPAADELDSIIREQ